MSSLPLFAQEEVEENEQAIENMAAADDGQLQSLNDNVSIGEQKKYNINTITENELFSLSFLNPQQINQFLLYRKTLGLFISLLELQAVPNWDITTIKTATGFFRVEREVQMAPEMKQRIKEGSHMFLYRTGGSKFGYSNGSSTVFNKSTDVEKGYKQLIKYTFQFQNLMQWGFTMEKDAGEKNFADHTSGYLMVRKKGIINTLIIGDYLVNMGQGLIHWQGYAFGKSNNIIGGYRQGEAIRPHSGSDENRYHRGIATTFEKKKLLITVFAGQEKIDANIMTDTSIGNNTSRFISSFLTSGLHAKASDLADKNSVKETVFGSRLGVQMKGIKMAINYINTMFDVPIKKRYQPYNYHAISGNRWQNTSLDFSTNSKNIFLFGEAAIDQKLNKAIVTGLVKSFDTKLDATIIYRNIDKSFRSLQSNAMTQNTEANNERGIFSCVNFLVNTKTKIDGYADYFINPWVGYYTDGIRRGKTFSIQFTWKSNKKTEFYSRIQQDERNGNYRMDGDKTNRLGIITNTKWRTHLSFMPHESFTIRQRIELAKYVQAEQPFEIGFMSYLEIIYKPMLKPYSLSARMSIFETGGYNARIYAYERDLLSYYSIPAMYDKGIRHYLLMQYKISKSIQIWFKYIHTKSAPNGIVYGSSSFGNNLKKEWRLQVICHF